MVECYLFVGVIASGVFLLLLVRQFSFGSSGFVLISGFVSF